MDNQTTIQNDNFLGSGWSFPVTFLAGNYQLNLSAYEANIRDSLNIILFTRKGERTMEPDFGSGLQQFIFKKMDETLRGEIAEAVRVSLLHNEPRITLEDVAVDFTNLKSGEATIKVSYLYNQTNTRHNYVFPFHLNEGTNLK